MENFFALTTQDPVLLTASFVLVATVIVLLWAIRSLKVPSPLYEIIEEEEELPVSRQPEFPPFEEARFKELFSRLDEINQRLESLEQAVRERGSADATVPIAPVVTPDSMEAYIRRIETRLDQLASAARTSAGPAPRWASAIDEKIDELHRLISRKSSDDGEEKQ